MPQITLDTYDLAIASTLLLAHAGISVALRLGLARALLWSALRMIVQLSLVGVALRYLIEMASPLWTALAATAMILFAGREVLARQERRFSGVWTYGIGSGSMLIAASLVTLLALTASVQPEPWYAPRYSLPLLGMILGNTMTGVSLGLDTLTQGAHQRRTGIEAQLALGSTRWVACRPVIREAMRKALLPIINSMAATGLVALPGMMTGQILAGESPEAAVRYQLLIMFLIAGGTSLGSLVAVYGGVLHITDPRHRLRLDRLS